MGMASAQRSPASLLVRTNLILGFSALLIAAIATLALYAFVIDPINEQSADDEAALLVLSAQTWVELPPAARPYYELEMAENHDLIISEDVQPLADSQIPGGYFNLLKSRLSARLDTEIKMLEGDELLWVNVPMGGRELQIGFSPEREDVQPLNGAIVIVSLGAAIVFFSSLFIVQRIARPLVQIALQAEHFRGSGNIEPLPETGPRELASLAQISALLANRTTLLAGISHDLRTPLTRMRLALTLLPENVDPALIERFERNLESMDELVGDALRFARGAGEAPQEIDIVSFTREIVGQFEHEVSIHVEGEALQRALVAPSAFSRVLINLISNGVKHGGRVVVTVSRNLVEIADNGPGIPVEYREQVFQPFFRLDMARQSTTGGSGLGLAIVSQLCQVHGWHVSIGDSAHGGASIRLEFGLQAIS
jgi:two-component system osmolarity sensor histidine kinase EnvZ